MVCVERHILSCIERHILSCIERHILSRQAVQCEEDYVCVTKEKVFYNFHCTVILDLVLY